MSIRHTFRPHCMALAISIALGHAGSAHAQEPAPSLPLPAAHLTAIETFINRPETFKTEVTARASGPDGIALKLGDDDDLVMVSRRGRFNGIVDGGGGLNILQLDTLNGGALGESKNFNQLFIKRGFWTRTGENDFHEGAMVADKATLTNLGRIGGQVSVDKGATFRGKGSVHHLQVAGRLEVNALHGAPHVRGNLELQDTAELAYEVNADGQSQTIQVDGGAQLGNATLKVVAVTGEYPLSSQYVVMTANKVDGVFGKLISDLAFFTPAATYDAKSVGLTFTRNDVPLEKLAFDENGRALGKSVREEQVSPPPETTTEATHETPIHVPSTPASETSLVESTLPPMPEPLEVASTPKLVIEMPDPASAEASVSETDLSAPIQNVVEAPETSIAQVIVPPPPEAAILQGSSPATQPAAAPAKPDLPTNAAIAALLGSDKATAAIAIEQLAAGINANLANATLRSIDPVNASMLSAMRKMDRGNFNAQNSAPSLAAGGDADGRVWFQALGNGGTVDRGHVSSALQHSTKGLVLGADWALDEQWSLGVIGAKSQTRLDGSRLDGDLDSWHLGAYALRQSGPLAIRLGASHGKHAGSTKRQIAFNGFSDRPKGRYDANTQQAFAEFGYNLGNGMISAEPFANFGYQRYHRDSYTEKGGAAKLQVHGQTRDNFSSTFGLRLAQLNTLDNGMQVTPRFSAGWKHTYGDVDSKTRQRLVTGGKTYTVEGAALDRDSLMLDAGLDLAVSPRHTLGVGYNGEIGKDSRSHGVMGQWRMAF